MDTTPTKNTISAPTSRSNSTKKDRQPPYPRPKTKATNHQRKISGRVLPFGAVEADVKMPKVG
jgi:hypothetical protein